MEQDGTVGLIDEVRMSCETVAMRTKQYLVQISSASCAARVGKRTMDRYPVAYLHTDTIVSYNFDIVLQASVLLQV